MDRHFNFKRGRASAMLIMLDNKENTRNNSNDDFSADVIEGTPSPPLKRKTVAFQEKGNHTSSEPNIITFNTYVNQRSSSPLTPEQLSIARLSQTFFMDQNPVNIIEGTPSPPLKQKMAAFQEKDYHTISESNLQISTNRNQSSPSLLSTEQLSGSGAELSEMFLMDPNEPVNIIERTPSPPPTRKTLQFSDKLGEQFEQPNNEFLKNITIDNSKNDGGTNETTTEHSLIPLGDQVNLEDDLYLSDDSVADPLWVNPEDIPKNNVEESDNSEPEINAPRKIKTTRWHKKNTEKYDRNLQKTYRSQCLPYKNYKKNVQPPKAPKPCDCKCKLNCMLNFTEEDRNQICKLYWGLSNYCRQKDFLLTNITSNTPQRRLVSAVKKRTVSRSYFFTVNERKIKVCEKFFKATLCISNGPINKALSEVGTSGSFAGIDRRGRHQAHNKTKQEQVEFVKEHIESFPTMESHYCRKSSSKKYLDSNLSISKMYELYEEKCRMATKTPVSINVYRNIFCTQYNMDFHKPKKDTCLMCHKYNSAKKENSTDLAAWQQKYEEHVLLKEQSRKAKDLDKIRANSDENFNSITLDLQKVLHMPSSNVSLLYYLRKLNIYNATIYEARKPNDGLCYLWSEIDGKKGSAEVGTALYLWIKRLPLTITEISIFSDTCGGQNRNQYLLCLLLYLVQTTHLEVIEQKYLESGHTHMEVDSIHSAIENQMRYMSILSMTDLCNVIRLARSDRNKKQSISKKPYEPIVMDYTDMLDLKDLKENLLQNRLVSTDGEKLHWLKVKSFRFEKKSPNIVKYRYDYSSEYKELNVSSSATDSRTGRQNKNLRKRKHDKDTVRKFDYNTYILKKAYNKKLPITKAKKRDLLKMCSEKIIPPELHHWYQTIPDKEGRDVLPEDECSDAEESSDVEQ